MRPSLPWSPLMDSRKTWKKEKFDQKYWKKFVFCLFYIERRPPASRHDIFLIEWIILFQMSLVSSGSPQEPMPKIIPFPEKVNFRRKFMVFLKIFWLKMISIKSYISLRHSITHKICFLEYKIFLGIHSIYHIYCLECSI